MDSSLPAVLAGPIVRRVEPRLCAFWIALSEAYDSVTATVWSGIQMAGAAGAVEFGATKVGSATVKTRRFGTRLYVTLIAIKLSDSRKVQGISGDPYDRTADEYQRAGRQRVSGPPVDATLVYRMAISVPDNWILFLPVAAREGGSDRGAAKARAGCDSM